MKVKKKLRYRNKKKVKERSRGIFAGVGMLIFCITLTLTFSVTSKAFDSSEKGKVYATSEEYHDEAEALSLEEVVLEVDEGNNEEITITRIGTSCEQVVVGQRVQTIQEEDMGLDVSESMETVVNFMDDTVTTMSASAKIMSDEDYQTMLKIVEAEAGTEDIKGRVLVANVIMNRVNEEEFPDTVTEVVYEYKNGVPQFSPVYDGRIYQVTISEETKEAVKLALEGVDYSDGALFFIMKSAAEEQGINWFEKELKYLFKHGSHEFYTYPDEEMEDVSNDTESIANENVIQVAKK